MSGARCPGCGFTGAGYYSPEWYADHEQHHLATFPDLDQTSRDNLAAATARANQEQTR